MNRGQRECERDEAVMLDRCIQKEGKPCCKVREGGRLKQTCREKLRRDREHLLRFIMVFLVLEIIALRNTTY